MSIALNARIKELERRIAELEARPLRCTCPACFRVGPAEDLLKSAGEPNGSLVFHVTPSTEIPPEMLVKRRKPGRPPKNG